MAAQEKQKRFKHLRAFERNWLLFSDSLLLARTGHIGFWYLSYLNTQVAVDNANLCRKAKMQKQPLCASSSQSDIRL